MKIILALLLLSCCSGWAKTILSATHAERIADAIYVVEGGSKAQVPYGILSMKVNGKAHARQICLNTIRNTHARWIKAGAKGNFLNYLADRYCPPADSTGNANWKRNIHSLLAKKSPNTGKKTLSKK